MIKMFTSKEEKNLSYVLSKSADQDSMLFLEELHGLLFGLALTPAPVMPSEWLPVIFDKEPQFDDAQDAQTCMGHLFDTYNRMVGDFNKGKLAFPFNLKKLNEFEHSLIEGWTYGLLLALRLRLDIWGISEEYKDANEEDIPDEIMDLMDSLSIIMAIALPDEREEIIQTPPGHRSKDPEELEAALYDMLPQVVQVLQEYSASKRKALLSPDQGPKPPAGPRPKKIGPNEPCPCGSGRKYKKCCGSN